MKCIRKCKRRRYDVNLSQDVMYKRVMRRGGWFDSLQLKIMLGEYTRIFGKVIRSDL